MGRRTTSGRRPTIVDVATAAGVSRGTVSRVLNGGQAVSPDARLAVAKAMRRIGYVANPHARALAANRSGRIAFVLAAPRERLFEDPNLALMLDRCTETLAANDASPVVLFAGADRDAGWLRAHLARNHADGALLASMCTGSTAVRGLLATGMPVIGCGKPLGYRGLTSYVTVDDRDAARRMVTHLRSRGRHRIATVTGPLDTAAGVERLAGYREVVGGHDPRLEATGDYTRASGEAAMRRLLDHAPDLDAVFVASDLMAAGALAALHRAGRRVPDDVAVGGFDDSHIAGMAGVNLTTVRQPWNRISDEMVRLLLGLIGGDEPSAVVLPTELVIRGTA